MAQNNTTRWEAPQFSFNMEDQAVEWKKFYTRAIDYLETIDIDPEQEDQNKRGWKQIKMMFTREDRQALQTMIDNNTITQQDQCTPVQGQATGDIAADLQVDLLADHLQEPHHTIDAQEDTEKAQHHITSTLLPLQDAMQYQPTTQKTIQHN